MIGSGSHGFEGFDYLGDMSAPAVESLFALGQEFVALIDCRHPRNRPRLVVEDFVGNVRRNAQASHSGDHGSSQIVHAPSRDGA